MSKAKLSDIITAIDFSDEDSEHILEIKTGKIIIQ